MPLNKSKGNMYDFVTHTWNTIKGKCYHDCSYCYMKRWGTLKETRFDEKELKTDLGNNNFIFVGSSCDMFADDIQYEWINKTLNYCDKFDNKYLFQSKNPERFLKLMNCDNISKNSVFCTTIETNRWLPDIMKNCPDIMDRAIAMYDISCLINTYVTIEPIIDFDIDPMVKTIMICNPVQVNIGADSGGHNLPEPSKEKILELIHELEKFTIVKQKKNLKRILG